MKPKIVMIATTIILLCVQQTVNNTMETSIEKNKAVVRSLIEQVMNKRKTELVKELISPDYTSPLGAKGSEAFLQPVKPLIAAFPDIEWKIEDMIAEGDKVLVRWKWQGMHSAQFNNFPATAKTVTNDGMAIFELKNEKVISTNTITDRLGFVQQMTYKDRVQFIDKFTVPSASRQAFYERMRINREFIKKLPGFLEDHAYEHIDDAGNLVCVTIAHWVNMDEVNKAKEAVQAEYRKQGFDPAEMFKRLNISLERFISTEVKEN